MTAVTITEELREPDPPPASVPDHHVVVIGAGMSGIGMGIALRRAGIEDFAILERAGDIGGTWRDNTYPGIGVDIPAQAYQFSYELKPDWSRVFAKGHEVKAYVDQLADRYGIRPFVRLDSEVSERVWDEDHHLWRLRINGGEEVTARFVISAIGPFVDPKPARIPGLEAFRGKVIQSARWDHGYDLAGKRVAVVGTGASAVQIVPKIAREVAHLDVYQRTPIWVGPKFDPRTPVALEWLYRRLPFVQNVVRAATSHAVEGLLVTAVVHHDRVGFVTRALRRRAERFYASQVPDPELRRRLTPDYDIGCKRPAVSNTYLRTFMRENVELVTDPIERVTETGIVTALGEEREIDTLVLATGFWMATDPENFRRTPVRGRDGFDLAAFYERERALSYESVSMPGLPNHFMIFGPYGWTGGTWQVLVETASTHILRVIEEAGRRAATCVEVRPEAARRWTDFAVDRLGRSLWQGGSCATSNSYYFDRHGDTPFLRPTSSRQAWRACRSFPLADYDFAGPGSTLGDSAPVAQPDRASAF